jgi:photosystem I subunit 3
MRRLFALVLAVCLWFGFASIAPADASVLTPCSQSEAFNARAALATTPQEKARFERYSAAMCGEEGLPHLTDNIIPGIMFIYIAGWIGWAGRSYLIEVRKRKNPAMDEIFIDTKLAISCSMGAAAWPLKAFGELTSGALTAKEGTFTTSPR